MTNDEREFHDKVFIAAMSALIGKLHPMLTTPRDEIFTDVSRGAKCYADAALELRK